jgi:hypothetical protein
MSDEDYLQDHPPLNGTMILNPLERLSVPLNLLRFDSYKQPFTKLDYLHFSSFSIATRTTPTDQSFLHFTTSDQSSLLFTISHNHNLGHSQNHSHRQLTYLLNFEARSNYSRVLDFLHFSSLLTATRTTPTDQSFLNSTPPATTTSARAKTAISDN